jgi:hypothetical protein
MKIVGRPPGGEQVSIAVLAPQSMYKTLLKTSFTVSQTDKKLFTDTFYVYVWGELTYLDVFGKQHNTWFCSSRKGSSGEFMQCPFHNYAD